MATIEDLILGALPSELEPYATIGDLPATQSDHIGIMLYDGSYNTEYFGEQQGSTIFNPLIKIVVRNHSYEKANDWCRIIKETLHRYTSDKILSIFLIGFPMYLGRDPQGLQEFQLTFVATLIEEPEDKGVNNNG